MKKVLISTLAALLCISGFGCQIARPHNAFRYDFAYACGRANGQLCPSCGGAGKNKSHDCRICAGDGCLERPHLSVSSQPSATAEHDADERYPCGVENGSVTYCDSNGAPIPVPQYQPTYTNYYQSNSAYTTPVYKPSVAENGSYYGQPNAWGAPKTVHVRGYYRKDGTYVRGHYRSKPRR